VTHHLSIRCLATNKLILAIHLTPIQALALAPYVTPDDDDPALLQCYSLENTCELFIEGDPQAG